MFCETFNLASKFKSRNLSLSLSNMENKHKRDVTFTTRVDI